MNSYETNKKTPKYEKMKQLIISMIESGELQPNDKLPTEEELAARFSFTVTTTRKALTDLAREGIIYRIKKKGTFVSDISYEEPAISTAPRTVSFILPLSERTDNNLMQFVRGAQSYFSEHGYAMLIEATNDQIALENEFIEKAIEDHLPGLIIFPFSPEENRRSFFKLKQRHIPFVLIDRFPEHFPVNSVVCDNFDGSFQATEHLISLGHKKILFVTHVETNQAESVRHSGYCMAMQTHGLEDDLPILSCRQKEEICQAVKDRTATAFVCANDYCALELLRTLTAKGYSVPEDVSLVGFDGQQATEFVTPPLTTVFQPCFDIGQTAAQLLVNLIENNPNDLKQAVIPVHLLIRGSTAAPSTP